VVKVLGIAASPRHGNTEILVREALKKLKSNSSPLRGRRSSRVRTAAIACERRVIAGKRTIGGN